MANLLLAFLFLVPLFLVPLRTLLGPRQAVSYYEQRPLATRPALTPEALWSGQFFTDLEAAASDHIPRRDALLKLYVKGGLALGKTSINGVVTSADVLLDDYGFSRWGLGYLPEEAARTAEAWGALDREIGSWGGYFCYLGLPLQSTYFAGHYPEDMDGRQWHAGAVREAFGAAMAEQGVPFLDLYPAFEALGFPKEFYYETDHHFTMEGAFFAYTALMERVREDTGLALSVLGREDLTWTTLPNPFLGSANRKLYGLRDSGDALTLAEPKEDIPFERWDNGVPVPAEVFALPEAPGDTVTYGAYMGGDIGETRIATHRPELPSVLIFGDSFTNPIETVLWASFDETRSLDFRYYDEKSLTDYLRDYQPEVVLCVRDESVYLSRMD